MNLFLPEESIVKSVIALDDLRLKKQIIECAQILRVSLGLSKGYNKHPVVVYYRSYPSILVEYGLVACEEYYFRNGKELLMKDIGTSYWSFFSKFMKYSYTDSGIKYYISDDNVLKHFYCEGSKDSPNAIRTTENTVELFRAKLCKKWDNDKYPPKWTNREPPEWYHSNRE